MAAKKKHTKKHHAKKHAEHHAKKKHHAPAGHVVSKHAVTRKKGHMYFVDGQGNVRETKMNRRGGKKGRKVCR